MAETDKPDHWGQLASDIGAEVPPEERQADHVDEPNAVEKTETSDERAQPLREETQVSEASVRAKPTPRQQAATDWSALAEELGIEVEEEAEEEETPTEEPEAPSTVPASTVPAEPPPVTAVALTTETTLGSFGAGIQQLTVAVERAEVVPDAPKEVEQPLDEETKRPRRRKKRRRKSRRGERTETWASDEPHEEVDILEADEETVFSSDAGEESDGDRTSDEPSSESPARGKRRRRRGRKAAKPSGDTIEGGTDPAKPDAEADEAAAASEPAKPARTKKEKSSHRKIPSWDEAVNLIISRNVEQRSKSHSGSGAPRHRGRRGGRPSS
jgi:hypothetical protein